MKSQAAGEAPARADIAGSREQQEVASAFNDMTARLGNVLEAQRAFVANASHQLRTPLTGLRLRLEAASLMTADPAVQKELEAAERETERLARLLAGLLSLAAESDRPTLREPAELGAAAEAALERWQVTAERAGRRLVLTGEEPVAASISGEDVAIVLDNLIENALNYSPRGGTISLEWDRQDGVATISVLDEGPGLEPGEETRVFERFARGSAADSAPGTGLGLSIVQTLARRWAGEARIGNRPSGGARASVRLPLAPLPTANGVLEKALPPAS